MWSIIGNLPLKLLGHRLQLKKNRIIWAEGSLPVHDKLSSLVGITDCSMGSETDCWPFSAVLFQTLLKSLFCQITRFYAVLSLIIV